MEITNDYMIFNSEFLNKRRQILRQGLLPPIHSNLDVTIKYNRIKKLVGQLYEMASALQLPATVTPDKFKILEELFEYDDTIINRTNLTNWCRSFLSRYFSSESDKFLQIIDKEERQRQRQQEAMRIAEEIEEEQKKQEQKRQADEQKRQADVLDAPFFRYSGGKSKSKSRRKSKSHRINKKSK